MRSSAVLAAAVTAIATLVSNVAVSQESGPIAVSVSEVRAPVGRPTELIARLSIKEGYRFIEPQPRGNRVIELSSADGGVSFARRVVRGRLEGGSVVFRLELTPTKPGPHPINGVIRVSYVTDQGDSWHLRHVSLPLIATVVGTE